MLVFYLVLFLLVIGTAVTLSFTVLFRIEEIKITGESRYSAEQILEAAAIEPGENLFLADTGTAARSVETKLPYIGEAKIRRVLPATLLIEVSEEKAFSAVVDDAQYVVLSAGGKVLERVESPPEGCPVVKGLTVESARLGGFITYQEGEASQVYASLSKALEESGLTPITAIDLTDPYSSTVLYDGRILLELGPPTSFPEKLKFFSSLLEEGNLTAEDAGTLDLSLADENDHAYFSAGSPVSSAPAASAAASSQAA